MKLSDNARAALDTVIRRFQTGDLSPIVHIARITPAEDSAVPADRWSFSNRLLAFIQTGDLDCRGFRQWQQVNRHVKAGARAAYILVPCVYSTDEDGEEKAVLKGFRTAPVFGLSATDGEPLPPADYTPAHLPPLAHLAEQFGITTTYAPVDPSRYGWYNPATDSITLGTHDPKTWFHELAHAMHARITTLKGGQDPHQETTAEFTACVLMHLYGLGDRSGNAWRYIQMYNRDPLTAIVKALADVEQILELLNL